ncbi:MAG: enoyl-CoA hydratase/isomerase family protein [Pseudomonadota bacterium]
MTLPQTETLKLELEDGWLTIRLNRPEVRNALSQEMTAELRAVVDAVAPDRSVRGVTLRGEGGIFCAGGDIKGFRANFHGEGASAEETAAANARGGELFDALNELPQVLVVLIEGAAIAGGLGMACTGDVVAVTRDARFAVTETSIGIPPAQIAPFVVARIGQPAARRLMLTGARFDGAEAGRIGLADHVAEDAAGLEAYEAAIRKQVRRCAPGANAATKEILMAAPRLSRPEMRAFAAGRFAACMMSEEGREGVASFLEKRKPAWAE